MENQSLPDFFLLSDEYNCVVIVSLFGGGGLVSARPVAKSENSVC